jgi:hypothetical protein
MRPLVSAASRAPAAPPVSRRRRRGPSRVGLLFWTVLVAAGAGAGGYAYAGGFDNADAAADSESTERYIAAAVACLKLEAPAMLDCVETGLADGSILPSNVSVPLQNRECVIYRAYFGEPEQLTDLEFTAVAIAGAPCFSTVADTASFEFAINYPEFVAPDCLEGRNPKVARDREYLLRMLACATASRPGR